MVTGETLASTAKEMALCVKREKNKSGMRNGDRPSPMIMYRIPAAFPDILASQLKK